MNLLCYKDNGASQMGFVVGETYEGNLLSNKCANVRGPKGSRREGKMTMFGVKVWESLIEDPEQKEYKYD